MVRAILTDLSLSGDTAIELLLMQWRTSPPLDSASGVWVQSQDAEVNAKRVALQALSAAVSNESATPLFLVLPELSLPLSLIPVIDGLVESAGRPTVCIAGLEHMLLAQFSELRVRFDDSTDVVGPDARRRVNAAAIWIKTPGTGARRYLQVKRGLSDPELNDFCHGSDSFVFVSEDQNDSARLNFAVAICSAFTNYTHVTALRREMALTGTASLDLMFLVEMNERQDALQFRTSIRAFFEAGGDALAGSARISTASGALVFVNNAASLESPSLFGQSAIHFRYDGARVARAGTPPTYFIEAQGQLDYFSAVLRDSHASAYLLEYVPLALRTAMPGSNEPLVLRAAKWARLPGGTGSLVFSEIPPVVHWLLKTWSRARPGEEKDAADNIEVAGEASVVAAIRATAVKTYIAAWVDCIEWWRRRLDADDGLAMRQLRLLTDMFRGEPELWELAHEARLMLRAFVLLTFNRLGACLPGRTPCSHFELDDILFVLVSGMNRWTWRVTINEFYRRHRTQLDALTPTPVAVVQSASDEPPWNVHYLLPPDFVADPRFENDISGDDIVSEPVLKQIPCTSAATLYGTLCNLRSANGGAAGVAARVGGILQWRLSL